MKKYEKPRVYIERFELSQHIAACAWDMSNYQSAGDCTATADPSFGYPDGTIAFAGTNCTDAGGMDIEDYCYTNGNEGINIFNS